MTEQARRALLIIDVQNEYVTGNLSYANKAGSASAEEIHRTFSIVMQANFAAVINTDEWLQMLQTNGVAERDDIYTSNQRARTNAIE